MLAVSKKKLDINDKYLKQLEDIKIRVPKGYREVIQDFAKEMGFKGVNPFVISLINEKMEEKNYADRIPTGVKEINKEKDESADQ
ncbi:MAG: hypothetical protein IJN64_14110 [Lachnospiraceae bacterium]|nr:hypothetical protein [Lachnospiraceae bacterium]